MKKIELHVHFDGSLSTDYASKLCGRDVKKEMIATGCNNLVEYLSKFDLAINLLQSYDNIRDFAYFLGKDFIKDEVIYAEVRFCPLFHTKEISVDCVIDAVKEGFSMVKGLKVNLIFCMMRHFSFEENKKIIELTKKYLGNGVCGIDLAGDEAGHKTKDFEELFDIVKKYNIPYTIHSGEADGPESVRSAIKFGTKRLGHGVRSIEDAEVVKMIKENNIYLEVCPTSNLDTDMYESISKHPIDKLYKDGVLITINTDNRTVSNTNLNNEYKLLRDAFGYTDEDFIKFNLNAIDASFLNQEEKEKLKIKLLEK